MRAWTNGKGPVLASSSTIGEMRGGSLRIEIGPKDAAKGSGGVWRRRDRPGRDGKSFRAAGGLCPTAVAEHSLVQIQAALLQPRHATSATRWHTKEPSTYEEFKAAVETGFALGFWCGTRGARGARSRRKPRPRCAAYL